MISVSKINYYLFVLIIFSSQFFTPDITFFIGVLGLLIEINFRGIPKRCLSQIRMPFYLLLLGLIFSYQNVSIDIIRDVFYFINPIVIFLFGYLSARRISFQKFIKTLVFLGVLFSFIFIFGHNFNTDYSSIRELRQEEGITSYVVVISLSILIISKIRNLNFFPKPLRNIFLIILALASILAFSRTFLLVFVLCMIFGLGILRFDKKLPLKIIAVITLLLFGAYSVTSFGTDDRSTFIGKLRTSIDEISIQDYSDKADINSNWRGYEAYKGIEQIQKGSLPEIILGQGFGALTPLGVEIQLGEKEFSEIPKFHNGFITILLKTGILGLIIYSLFFLRLIFSNLNKKSLNYEQDIAINFSAAFSIVLLLTTFVIAGWLNQAAMIPLILGLGFFLNSQKLIEHQIESYNEEE